MNRALASNIVASLLTTVSLSCAGLTMSCATAPGNTAGAPAAAPHSMVTALEAAGPHPSLGAQAPVFGRFVGSWDCEYNEYSKDGKVSRSTGEETFGWVMEGRAIQDVVVIYPSAAHKNGFIGTFFRFFDPKSGTWRVTFIDPEDDAIERFSGGAEGDDRIVLHRDEGNGRETRWSYVDIHPDSFIFRDEESRDGGQTWWLREEDRMTRRSTAAAPAAR